MKLLKTILALWVSMQCLAYGEQIHPLDNMRILGNSNEIRYGHSLPVEQRGIEFRKFLSMSVQVKTAGGAGSGSIIYYDKRNNLAYVASCGHLWTNGVVNSEEAARKNVKCKIITWYKNSKKLESPEEFEGKLLFYSYTNEVDTSLVVFSPDWIPSYLPIAPVDYEYSIGLKAHSLGCDGAKEVAHYEVTIVDVNGDVVTKRNSPRPGRSGGGLFNENLYIGTCWGTEFIDGSGRGFFTPVKDIHNFWGKQKGYDFLLKVKSPVLGRLIPIKDRNSKVQSYQEDYILAP
jgi:hypothetical protein